MLRLLVIALGGSVGALARYGLSGWVSRISGRLPYGTLVVNVVGSSLIGLVLTYSLCSQEVDPHWRALIVTGFLGAFTTFSTLSYETLALLADGSLGFAALNMAMNVFVGMVAVWLGSLAGRTL